MCFSMHPPRQTSKVSCNGWLFESRTVFPCLASGCIRENCQQWCERESFRGGGARDYVLPLRAVHCDQSCFGRRIRSNRTAQVFEQVFKAKKRTSDIRFRPIEECTAAWRNNDVAWVKIKVP